MDVNERGGWGKMLVRGEDGKDARGRGNAGVMQGGGGLSSFTVGCGGSDDYSSRLKPERGIHTPLRTCVTLAGSWSSLSYACMGGQLLRRETMALFMHR